MEKGRIMAIDYGSAKIGLAVTDQDRLMAFGRGVMRKKELSLALTAIMKMIEDEKVVKVVIGLPLSADGGETGQSEKIRAFGGKLAQLAAEKSYPLQMDFIDESFSSFEADRIMRELGATAEQKKETEDEMAAVILLHRYMDFRP